jgi:hypothetical protein
MSWRETGSSVVVIITPLDTSATEAFYSCLSTSLFSPQRRLLFPLCSRWRGYSTLRPSTTASMPKSIAIHFQTRQKRDSVSSGSR